MNLRTFSLCALSALAALPGAAQIINYRQVNLVSCTAGLGLTVDPSLARPWGLALFDRSFDSSLQ